MPLSIPFSVSAAPAFDSIAETYDQIFTESLIGRAQRDAVWSELRRLFRPPQRILEINCGTGVDAAFLSGLGVRVDAFDISARMIDVAKRRFDKMQGGISPHFGVLAIEHLDQLQGLYDGVFSNFGGLNCVPDLALVAKNLARLTRVGAHVILCLANRTCLWELVWYCCKGNWQKATRRFSDGVIARIAEQAAVHVQYPTVRTMRKIFSPEFQLRKVKGVGVTVPPSYLESLALRFPNALGACVEADRLLSHWPLARSLADHVFLHFERV
jgi:ubiquinone/menaquinone biosynthesis C-methylase UbiE